MTRTSVPNSRRAPRCSIIIRCLNEEQNIGRLLAGIEQQSERDYEIIVVDSGSTDSTLAIAGHFETRILHIAPEAFSFGRSLNLGCSEARGEHLVFVSAHCYPIYQDWLARLLDGFSDPDVVLVYGKQRGAPTSSFAEHRVFARWFPDEGTSPPPKPPFCNNANAALRRRVWKGLPFDETLTGLEDIDWAKRAIGRGHRIAYSPAAEIIHVHNESARQVMNRYRREAIALKRIFPEEHFDVRDFVTALGSNLVNDLVAARREQVLITATVDVVRFRTMQFLGTLLGFQQSKRVDSALKRRMYYPDRGVSHRAHRARAAERIDYSRPRAPTPAAEPGLSRPTAAVGDE